MTTVDATRSAHLDEATLRRALTALGTEARIDVSAEQAGLLRFGESRITYQHSEERLRVRAQLYRAGRTAWGTIESLDIDAVRRLGDRLRGILADLPPRSESCLPAVSQHQPRPALTCHDATLAGDASERIGWLRQALDGLAPETMLGGSAQHTAVRHVIADTAGLYRDETRTRAALQLVGRRAEASSYARLLHRDASKIQPGDVLPRLAHELRPLPAHDLAIGRYRVVLSPQAVATLLATYGHIAFGWSAYQAGISALSGKLGEQVTANCLEIVDDAADDSGLPTGFDSEGTPKQRVVLVAGGVLQGLVHDHTSASAAGMTSSGHAVPPAWRFGQGPSPSHLLLAAGDADADDLLAACDQGIAIQRVDYVRVQHPKETLVTGTSRDATFWVQRGRVVARCPQFRFTVRLTDVFNSVLAVGRQRERSETVFMESLVTPAVVVDNLPVDKRS